MVYRSDCRFLPYSMHFSEFVPIFSRENGQNTKNTRSPPFPVWYENGRRWLLGAQSINIERASWTYWLDNKKSHWLNIPSISISISIFMLKKIFNPGACVSWQILGKVKDTRDLLQIRGYDGYADQSKNVSREASSFFWLLLVVVVVVYLFLSSYSSLREGNYFCWM